jgi:hypothetical protein
MSFLDHFRPKWKNPDAAVREKAVAALHDQALLESIAENDPSETVRLAAVQALKDQDSLARIARGQTPLAMPAFQRLTDQKLIALVAESAETRNVREMAVERIDDGVTLHRISTSDVDARVRLKARSKRAGPDETRDFIREELSKLALADLALEELALSGTLDEICNALISDARFRINGWLDQDVPGLATIRELDKIPLGKTERAPVSVAARASDCARFLAFKRGITGESEEAVNSNVFFEVHVWRLAADRFVCRVEEKRLKLIPDAVQWSRVSNSTENGARGPRNLVRS